ncbi:MAG: heme o synthase [Cyanobacteriota bacterium]|nr:heme o synthase [Cyanobacteriota bacterium]
MQDTLLIDGSESKLSRHHDHFGQVVRSYSQLIKPKIIFLLLVTTAGGMWIPAQGHLDPKLFGFTLLGGGLAAAAANAINMIYDSDIDQVMERTRARPIPAGRIQPRDALIFAVGLAVLSFSLLMTFANGLSACLAMVGIVVYVGVYTHWLKRSSTQNIVIGGAAGAIPPLVGWAAVTGGLSWPAWVLFAIIFLWTPPHFWALAILKQEDYARAGVPMLPVVEGEISTARQIFIYTLLILPVTLLLVFPFHVMGSFYGFSALGLGGGLIWKSWHLMQCPQDRDRAGGLFVYANLYLLFLCLVIGVDTLPITHQLSAHLWQMLDPLWRSGLA